MGMSSSFGAVVSAGATTTTWAQHLAGRRRSPPPPDALGLRYFTVDLPDRAALDQVIKRIDEAGIPSNQTAGGLLVQDPPKAVSCL
jgi:hypothetical protein